MKINFLYEIPFVDEDFDRTCDVENVFLIAGGMIKAKKAVESIFPNKVDIEVKLDSYNGEEWDVNPSSYHYSVSLKSESPILLRTALETFLTSVPLKPTPAEGPSDLFKIIKSYDPRISANP